MIAWTSRLGLREAVEGLAGWQGAVYAAIRDWEGVPGPSQQELAARLGITEGSCCGRIAELRAAGCIVDAALKTGPRGKAVKTYVALAWREPVYEAAGSGQGQLALGLLA